MERNQAIGLVLISVLFIVYFQFLSPQQEVPVDNATSTSSTPLDSTVNKGSTFAKAEDSPEEVQNDSIQQLIAQQQYGSLAPATQGKAQEVVLENEDIKVVFDTQGGKVKRVSLKGYKTASQQELVLLNEKSSQFSLLGTYKGQSVDFMNRFFFTPRQNTQGDTTILTFTTPTLDGKGISQVYRLPKKGFQLSHSLDLSGLGNSLEGQHLTLDWMNNLRLQESDMETSRQKATINYYLEGDGFDGISETSTGTEQDMLETPVSWVAMKQKFFTSAIIAKNNFSKGEVNSYAPDKSDTTIVKQLHTKLLVPTSDLQEGKAEFSYYFGPNNYNILKKVTEGLSKNVYLGWPPINMVNKFVIIPVFHFLEKFISNYGLIIIILVFFIKLLLSPLSYKSYISMAKMKVLKPEIDAIKEKHDGDMQKMQPEQMELYKKAGVSPISGCVPLLLQMPILFAMFTFFPNSIELRQESFLWAHDLSTYDSILNLPFEIPFYGSHVSLFTLLMTASTLLMTMSNNQVSTAQGPMKSISYVMPVVFMFVLNKYPAGLSFYYFVANLVTYGQQALIRKFVDEGKLRAIIDENKKKNANKKKSKFAARLEEAMKAQQQQPPKKKKK